MNTLDILATLLAQLLLNRLGLSTYHLAAVVPLIATVLAYMASNQSLIKLFQFENDMWSANMQAIGQIIPSLGSVICGTLLVCVSMMLYKWWNSQFIIFEINTQTMANVFIKYITLNKDKFSKFPSLINADPNILVYNLLQITQCYMDTFMKPGQTIYFRNTLFGTGYFTTHLQYVTCQRSNQQNNSSKRNGNFDAAAEYTGIKIPIYTCKLYIFRQSVNSSVFGNLHIILHNDNSNSSRNSPFIRITNYKIHAPRDSTSKNKPISIVEHVMYQGQNRSLCELEPIYMDTHFHIEKDRLWHMIKEIDQNKDYYKKYGQTPKLNALLYGPPGTGKSSFAYRVAMCLCRNIVSMDLTKYPSRFIIDNLMHGNISEYLENYNNINPNTLVYVFDEFDRTIEFLIASQANEKQLFECKLKSLTESNQLKAMLGSLTTDKENTTKKSEDNDSKEPIDDGTYASKLLTIKDLLEIFQGVVDVDGRLIFAMTNHFDKIKDECPALFRSGRLTPIHFGYIGQKTLIDIIQYYFKINTHVIDELTTKLLPNEFKIPTSEIIEQAIYYSSQPTNGYTLFIKWLIKRCDEIQ